MRSLVLLLDFCFKALALGSSMFLLFGFPPARWTGAANQKGGCTSRANRVCLTGLDALGVINSCSLCSNKAAIGCNNAKGIRLYGGDGMMLRD